MQPSLKSGLLTALIAAIFGFAGAAAWSLSGLSDNRTREYLIENPSILQDVAVALQAEQARARLADLGDAAYTPFPGAFVGNPQGSKVLVEFTDYNCTYCKASVPDVARLVAEDPELMVVMRELPQFDGSEAAARYALAAALQGKYTEFHDAMFAIGPANEETAVLVAEQVGLDLARARADAVSDAVTAELARNFAYARQMGFGGTPSWLTRNSAIEGMVGYNALKDAIAEAEE